MPGYTQVAFQERKANLGETKSFRMGSTSVLCSGGRHSIPSVDICYPGNESLEQRTVSVSLVRQKEME